MNNDFNCERRPNLQNIQRNLPLLLDLSDHNLDQRDHFKHINIDQETAAVTDCTNSEDFSD